MNNHNFNEGALLPLDSTLITPNRRLAATYLKTYHQFQITEKKSCWPSLDILPYQSWLQRLWREYSAKTISAIPIVLTPNQEQLLWEEIIRQSPESDYLLQITNTADIAKSAWGILKQWLVDIDEPIFKVTPDCQVFQKWAKQFHKICRQHNWLDTNNLANVIIEKVQQQEIIPPKNLFLLGFTELSPQQKKLFALCSATNTEQTLSHKNKNQSRISLLDEETEIHTMARWAKALIDQHTPAPSIACIIPNLETIRDRVIQIFSDIFTEKNTYTLDSTTLPFNISAGKSLSQYPVIHTALKLLSLSTETMTPDIVSHLLRSPFLGEAEYEMLQRAEFDYQLHRENLKLTSLQNLTQSSLEKTCPALHKRFQNFLATTFKKDERKLLSTWVNLFIHQLTLLGWPGERSLNSQEYQVVQRWLEVLNELTACDHILPMQTYSSALHYLHRLTANTIFQVQTLDAPVQILGLLEAAELPFDYLWVMGLDDTVWPPAPKPNPFIPMSLQKSLQMPHATSDREIAYCKQLTEQFKQSAEQIIFSHASQNDETTLRASPLIIDIKEIDLETLMLAEFIAPKKLIYAASRIELIQDEFATPLQQDQTIAGGVRIFSLQAACPFKAFAELRLHALGFDAPSLGLRPLDRGNIMHKILEQIWHVLGDQTTLLQQEAQQLQALIQECTNKVLKEFTKKNKLSPRYLALEKKRLHKLIGQWLAFEKTRPDFKVFAREEERTVQIGQTSLNLRVDRIDELADGGHLIIDYKTGKNQRIQDWLGVRLDEPQLPLYCISHTENTLGISFAQIHPDAMGMIGIAQKDIGIKSIKPLFNWSEQMQDWQQQIEKLGADFCQGNAKVDPKNIHETCRFCDLKSLCRIYERK